MSRTLPVDSEVRKGIPLYSGCYKYFAAALAGVARWSKVGNDKHNPGEPLHHARGKSMDHADCIARHSMDLADLLARVERSNLVIHPNSGLHSDIIDEVDALCWRALAWSQQLHEQFAGAPLAPAAVQPHKDDGKKMNAPNPIQMACSPSSKSEELQAILDKSFKNRVEAVQMNVPYKPRPVSVETQPIESASYENPFTED